MQQQKLSAYIREGAKKRPQAFDDYIRIYQVDEDHAWGPCEYRTCAIGAAYEGITGKMPKPDGEDRGLVKATIYNATGIKGCKIPYPPESFGAGFKIHPDILDLVTSLNDTEHWTREQIADYLESLGY